MNYDVEINIDGLEGMDEALYGLGDALGSSGLDVAGGAAVGAAMGGFFVFFVALYAVALLFGIAQYVMNGIAILRMAKKVGLANGWLGFIPFADVYMLGKIADVSSDKKVNAKRMLATEIAFFVLLIVYLIVTFAMGFVSAAIEDAAPAMILLFAIIALLYIAAAVCFSVFIYIAYYRISQNFGGKNSTGWFLGILLGGMFVSSIVPSILMLILSGKTPSVTVGGTPEAPAIVDAPPSDGVFN